MSNQATNKQALIAKIATQAGSSYVDAKTMLEATLTVIKNELSDGRNVTLKDFGAFKVKQHQARQGRNPRTGEALTIAAKTRVSFQAGKALNSQLNQH